MSAWQFFLQTRRRAHSATLRLRPPLQLVRVNIWSAPTRALKSIYAAMLRPTTRSIWAAPAGSISSEEFMSSIPKVYNNGGLSFRLEQPGYMAQPGEAAFDHEATDAELVSAFP